MSASVDTGQGGKGGSQDFELNLAPIIDCLTVLIAFLLASTAFISIGILDAGVAAAGSAATDAKPPQINLAVELGQNRQITVKISGKAHSATPIAKKGEDWNFGELAQRLAAIKAKWPSLNAVTLSADNKIEYREVVKTMEVLRKTVPVVLLGGF